MSSDLYYNVVSWFPGNVIVKPHFNTRCKWLTPRTYNWGLKIEPYFRQTFLEIQNKCSCPLSVSRKDPQKRSAISADFHCVVGQTEKIDIDTEYFRIYAQLFLHRVVGQAETITSVLENVIRNVSWIKSVF